ncbi:MAG TPA: serine/threonine-protein kinase [Planctomycetia bacterium]|nr:serine/threonine-protein kinase [Planctomycetia bacterium]
MADLRRDNAVLLAALALQNDLIPGPKLAAALAAWWRRPEGDFGEALVSAGTLSPSDAQLLTGLADRLRERHAAPADRLAALDLSSRARAALASISDPELQATLSAAAASESLATDYSGAGSRGAKSAPGSAALRYRILRPHAKGGLGEVFLAEDLELRRQVALKEIQRRHADEEGSRGRFVREAEITGGLEHPGIVPVYGLGAYGDGRPYYAMRFVRGDKLKEATRRFHEGAADFAGLEFRQLLGRFVDVCNAVAYAHNRGVLHRDLKPGNVMLGDFGETLVVDWGLAKVLGSPPSGAGATDEVPPFRPSGSTAEATRSGAIMGTPAFMSPEQAEGRVDELGPATDIYGLGAMLYALLAGKPPFEGTADAILDAVIAGKFPSPRSRQPRIPAALDAICLKAMARAPADRYATALDLSADVERYLSDEPVSAFPEPWPARAARWARKHRPQVAAAAALVLTSVVALSIGLVIVSLEQNKTAKERDAKGKALVEATRQKDAAERSLSQTQLALETVTDDALEPILSRNVQLSDSDREFLRKIKGLYESLTSADGETPAIKFARAEGLLRMADMEMALDESTSAESGYRRSIAAFEEILASSDASLAARARLAHAKTHLAKNYGFNARIGEAIALLEEAEKEHEQVVASDVEPRSNHYPSNHIVSLMDLAIAYQRSGRLDRAEASLRKATAVSEAMLKNFPGKAIGLARFADTASAYSGFLVETGRLNDAEAAITTARDAFGKSCTSCTKASRAVVIAASASFRRPVSTRNPE